MVRRDAFTRPRFPSKERSAAPYRSRTQQRCTLKGRYFAAQLADQPLIQAAGPRALEPSFRSLLRRTPPSSEATVGTYPMSRLLDPLLMHCLSAHATVFFPRIFQRRLFVPELHGHVHPTGVQARPEDQKVAHAGATSHSPALRRTRRPPPSRG